MVRHADVGPELSRVEWIDDSIHQTNLPAGQLLGSDGTHIVAIDPATVNPIPVNLKYAEFIFTLGDGANAIVAATEPEQWLEVPFDCQIASARLTADAAGNFEADIWKSNYASYPPVVANSITASAPPTLSSAIKSESGLTGWILTINRGDWLKVHVDIASTVKRVVLAIGVTRT